MDDLQIVREAIYQTLLPLGFDQKEFDKDTYYRGNVYVKLVPCGGGKSADDYKIRIIKFGTDCAYMRWSCTYSPNTPLSVIESAIQAAVDDEE